MTPREIQQRCHRFENIFIEHPGILAAENAIADLLQRLPVCDDAGVDLLCTDTDIGRTFSFAAEHAAQEEEENDLTQYCVLIIGEAGSGKTRLRDRLQAKTEFKEDRSGIDGDIVPLLTFDMPDMATPKALIEELCGQAGVNLPRNITRNALSRLLRAHLQKIGTKLIIIDEAHTLCEARSDDSVLAAARALKFLLNTCGVPMVLLGEEPLGRLKNSKALKRRVDASVSLAPYSWSDADDRFQFLDYLDKLDYALGFKKRSGLSDNMDLASRIYFASGGHIGLVVKFLEKALKLALRGDVTCIDDKILARAYDDLNPVKRVVLPDPDEIVTAPIKTLNPFLIDRTDFKRLWAYKFSPQVDEDRSSIVKRPRKRKSSGSVFGDD